MWLIKRGVPVEGRTYLPGEEAALAAVLTPEQATYLLSRGALEEDGRAQETASKPVVSPKEYFEDIVSTVFGELGIERVSGEKLRVSIARILEERDALKAQLEEQAENYKARMGELVQEKSFLEEQVAALTAPESPREQLIVALRDLGAEFIQVLLSAGFDSKEKVSAATDDELIALPKLGKARVAKIRELLKAE